MPNPPNFAFSIDLDASRSVAEQSEFDLVQYLCKEGGGFQFFARNYLDLEEGRYLLASNIVRPLRDDRRRKPGDIDVLLVPDSLPDQAIAFECKVVPIVAADYVRVPGRGGDKVPANEFAGDEGEYVLNDEKARNRYQALRRCVAQVTALCQLGFSRTYLCVIVAADMQGRVGYNWFEREITKRTYDEIVDRCLGLGLPEDCGIVIMQTIQRSEKPSFYAGGLELHHKRIATPRAQATEITVRVEQLLAAPLSYLEREKIVDSYVAPHRSPTLHCVPGKRQLRWDD